MIATSTVLLFVEREFNRSSNGYLSWTAPQRAQHRCFSASHCNDTDSSKIRFSLGENTASGIGFLRTRTWEHHVLRVAINHLKGPVDSPLPEPRRFVRAGSSLLSTIHLLALAAEAARACERDSQHQLEIEVQHGDCAQLAPHPSDCK